MRGEENNHTKNTKKKKKYGKFLFFINTRTYIRSNYVNVVSLVYFMRVLSMALFFVPCKMYEYLDKIVHGK